MPKYDFKCKTCEFEDELTFSMSDVPEDIMCPECVTGIMRKVFSAVPGHFKGTGWGKVYGTYKPKKQD